MEIGSMSRFVDFGVQILDNFTMINARENMGESLNQKAHYVDWLVLTWIKHCLDNRYCCTRAGKYLSNCSIDAAPKVKWLININVWISDECCIIIKATLFQNNNFTSWNRTPERHWQQEQNAYLCARLLCVHHHFVDCLIL